MNQHCSRHTDDDIYGIMQITWPSHFCDSFIEYYTQYFDHYLFLRCEQNCALMPLDLWRCSEARLWQLIQLTSLTMAIECSTLLPKIAAILLALAMLFHLIAISAPWWSVSNPQKTDRDEHVGLWKYCSSPIGHATESCFDFVDIITGGWGSCLD